MTKSIRDRFYEKIIRDTGNKCWGWNAWKVNGYACMWVDGKNAKGSRISYEMHVGPIPNGLWVLHRCDNRECTNPDHLFLGNRRDNIDDMVQKGRRKGERHNHAKLTEKNVLEMRALSKLGFKYRELSIRFGISQSHARDVIIGKKWGHIIDCL